MQVLQHITELQSPAHNELLWQRSASVILLLLQCLARDELHDQVGFATFFKKIFNVRQVHMLQRHQQFSLLPETRDGLRFLGRVELRVTHLLDGYDSLYFKMFVIRLIDSAKTALARHLDDAISPKEQLSRRQRSRRAAFSRGGSSRWHGRRNNLRRDSVDNSLLRWTAC